MGVLAGDGRIDDGRQQPVQGRALAVRGGGGGGTSSMLSCMPSHGIWSAAPASGAAGAADAVKPGRSGEGREWELSTDRGGRAGAAACGAAPSSSVAEVVPPSNALGFTTATAGSAAGGVKETAAAWMEEESAGLSEAALSCGRHAALLAELPGASEASKKRSCTRSAAWNTRPGPAAWSLLERRTDCAEATTALRPAR